MITDGEKYQRLIKYNKIMISLLGIIYVMIAGYVFIQMNEIIIPLVLAMIIYFLLNPVLASSEKKNITENFVVTFYLIFLLIGRHGFIDTPFPITFSIVQFDNYLIVVWIAVVLLSIHFLIGNVVEPKVVGKSTGISPVVVLFSLIFWGYVWGILGMVLAVPTAVFIKIILENISDLKPLRILMSDYKT